MGDKSIAFVEKAFEFAKKQPDLVPPYLIVDELGRDFELAKQLKKLLDFLKPFYEKVSDTFLAVCSEAFFGARVFYHSSKYASKANVPGSDAIARELQKRFKQ